MQSHIFNNNFLTYLALLSLPFVIIGFISIISYNLKSKNLNYTNRQGPLISTGIILGSGLGGFIDGILFHQILQWHDILSAVNAPDSLIKKQVNVFWDGLFHLFTLVFTIIGVLLLWNLFFTKGNIISNRIFVGAIVMGCGLFNIIEGTLNHYILNFHNVREITKDPQLYNHIFSGFFCLLLIAG